MTEQFSLSGRLEETLFPELLLTLSDRMETGVLRLSRAAIEKNIYFQEGSIVFATSNDFDERLGNLLLRRNKVSCRQLTDADKKVVPGKRLGTVLVLEGYITPTDLYHGVIDQIKEILYGVFEWSDGEYIFQSGPLPTEEVITLNLSTPDLILAGMSRIWRWSWVRKGSVSLAAVFRKREGWPKIVRKMTVTREIQSILDLLDRPRTLEEILQHSETGNFESCRLVWALLTIGIAEQILSAPPWVGTSEGREVGSTTAPIGSPDVTPVIHSGDAVFLAEPPTAKINLALAPSADAVADVSDDVFVPEPMPTQHQADASYSEWASAGMRSAEPAVDLSFSDLASLTDENLEAPIVQPVYETWEKSVPDDVNGLNERHRYLYEMLRLELGAGVNNFFTKTVKKVSARYPMVFDGVRMNDFGEFDKDSLVANIIGNLFENYSKAYLYLFEEEFDSIRTFLDKKRVDQIEAGLTRLAQKQEAAEASKK